MSLRLVIDQSHGEFLTISKTEIFQAMLAEMEFITFPLIDRPITLEKIKDDQVLFIGCPSDSFADSEISAIIQFVEMGNFLVLVSGSGGDFANNTNLSQITRHIEFEFNPDYVEDEKHNLNFSRIPILHKFKKSPITKRLKKLAYSGCSISILDPSTTPLVLTDSDSVPMKSPVMVLSENHRVLGIGGYSFFSDDQAFGIKAMDNLRLVYNILEFIKSRSGKKAEKIVAQLTTTTKRLTEKNAKKHFIKLITSNIKRMAKISEEIDKFWEEGSDLIKNQKYGPIENLISSNYGKFLQTITGFAQEIGNIFSEYNEIFPNFKESIFGTFNQWYETEAEIRAKLDMIRNNLISILKQEQPSS